jgi:hypothetical protein
MAKKTKGKRQNWAVAVDHAMHADISALAEEYSATLGFRVSRTAVIRMSLTALRYLRDRKAARNAKR